MSTGVKIAYTSEKMVINCPAAAKVIPNDSEILSRIPEMIYSEVPTKKLTIAKMYILKVFDKINHSLIYRHILIC